MATVDTPRRSGAGRKPPPSGSRSGNGRRSRKPRKRGFWYAVGRFLLAAGCILLIAGIAVVAIIYNYVKHVPTTANIVFAPKGRTEIISADGVTLAEHFSENRVPVKIEQIPKNLQNGTIAFEDKRFWTHQGVDPEGILRSIYANMKSHDLTGQGGSTIEQQLARNIGYDGLTSEKSYSRKIREWIVAQQIERSFSKQQILEMYLNQVNYGSGAWGVEAAAEVYFGKHVNQLDLAQCALLSGLPNRPTYYNPYRDPKAAEDQRNRVLQQMLEQHYITSDQFSQAEYEPVHLAYAHPPTGGDQIYSAPYFVNYVKDQIKREYGEDELDQGNLKVYTSLNFQLQAAAEKVVETGIDPNTQDGPNQACLIAMDPKTGEIKAMVGGVDFAKSNYNLATQARRQPGSLMKVVVYGAAIDSGLVNEYTKVYDAPETFKSAAGDWTPKDNSGYSYDHVTLMDAMAQSINTVAVKVLNMMGPETAVRYARVMGIDKSPLDPVLSLALGSSAVTPLEMTDVYATVANGGNRPEPMSVVRLADMNDNTIEDVQPSIDQGVLAPATVTQLNDMLRAVVTGGTGAGANVIPNAHGKTGTTQEHKDTWFIGYTPDLVVAIWAGHPLKSGPDRYGMPMPGNSWGATVCVPMWVKFMQKAIPIIQAEKAKAAGPAAKPAAAVKPGAPQTAVEDSTGTVTVTIDNDSGLLAPAGAPNSHQETFAKGAAPTKMAPQYRTGASPGAQNPSTAAPGAAPASDVQPDTSPDSQNGPDGETFQPAATAPSVTPPTQPATPVTAPTPTPAAVATPPAPQAAAAPPPPAPAPVAPPVRRTVVPQTVTVLINPQDGLLATQWDPVVVQRSYIKGQEPRKHSTMYGPPPGEH